MNETFVISLCLDDFVWCLFLVGSEGSMSGVKGVGIVVDMLL